MPDATAETGSDVGSNFSISRFHDDGSWIDNPFSINRATGQVTIPNLNPAGMPFLALAGGNRTVTDQTNFIAASASMCVYVSGDTTANLVYLERGWAPAAGGSCCMYINQLPWCDLGIDIHSGAGTGLRMTNTGGSAVSNNILMTRTLTQGGDMIRVVDTDGTTSLFRLAPGGNVIAAPASGVAVTANAGLGGTGMNCNGNLNIGSPAAGYPQLAINADAAYGAGLTIRRGASNLFSVGTDGSTFVIGTAGYAAPSTMQSPICVTSDGVTSIRGTTGTGDAPAGMVGEYLTDARSFNWGTSGFQMGTGAEITLTPGDWDVTMEADVIGAFVMCSIMDQAESALPTDPTNRYSTWTGTGGQGQGLSIANKRYSLAASFLLQVGYLVQATAAGTITTRVYARRVR
jgi:hypothetical protein